MMKKAFTMIELIFVIVIIGILTAVALPKMTNIMGQAKISKIFAYAGTLQRTTIPPYWSESIMAGDNGEINTTVYSDKINEDLDYPTEFGATKPNFASDLEDTGYVFTDGTAPTNILGTATINSVTYQLVCTNGDKNSAPKCDVYDGSQWVLTNNR